MEVKDSAYVKQRPQTSLCISHTNASAFTKVCSISHYGLSNITQINLMFPTDCISSFHQTIITNLAFMKFLHAIQLVTCKTVSVIFISHFPFHLPVFISLAIFQFSKCVFGSPLIVVTCIFCNSYPLVIQCVCLF